MGKTVRNPDFFLVGAPKCGTTAMTRYLSEHPQIFMSYRKEVHFYGSDLKKIPHEFFVLDEQRYLWLFAAARQDQLLGDASVMYLYSKSAPHEIKAANPDAKILVMLRNPVDVMYSHHSQLYWGGYEDLEDFEEALRAEPARRKGEQVPPGAMMQESLYYRDIVKFSEHVKRYFDVFGRDRVHVILFDDLKADTKEIYDRTLDFLGVGPAERESFRVVNPNKAPRFRVIQRWVRRPPLPARLALNLLPDHLRFWGLAKIARVNTKFVPRPPMTPELRAQLLSEFEPEVARLGELIDRDLGHWCGA